MPPTQNKKPPTTVKPPAKVSPKASTPAAPKEEKPVEKIKASAGSLVRSKNARTFDFGDDTVKGGYNDRPEAFKGKAGMTYIIRIITAPVVYYGAFIENKAEPNKSFFMQSRAKVEDAEAAYNGDDEAANRAAQDCPLFAKKFKIQRKFVCGIFIVGREDSKGRYEKDGRFMPWSFGGERYASLTNLSRSLPTKADGKRVSIHAVEIRATCKDDRYQKFDLMPVTSKNDTRMPWDSVWEEVKQHFDGDDRHSVCSKIEDFIQPDSKRDMIDSIDRADGRGEGGIEEPDDEKPAARSSKPGKKPAPKPEPEESDEGGDEEGSALDEALSDVEESSESGDGESSDELDDVE